MKLIFLKYQYIYIYKFIHKFKSIYLNKFTLDNNHSNLFLNFLKFKLTIFIKIFKF